MRNIRIFIIAVAWVHLRPMTVGAESTASPPPADETSLESPPSDAEPKRQEIQTPVQKSQVNENTEPEMRPQSPAAVNREIDRAMARLSEEPSLEALKAAALEQADAAPAETERWKRAARLRAILPTLKLTADYGAGRDEALDRYQEKPDRWAADTDRGYGFQASAQWKLDELIFNTDEVKVYDALADRAVRRESLLTVLVSYYFERRRLQLTRMLAPPTTVTDALEIRMRIAELTASIDALTGGLLSRKITRGNVASRRKAHDEN